MSEEGSETTSRDKLLAELGNLISYASYMNNALHRAKRTIAYLDIERKYDVDRNWHNFEEAIEHATELYAKARDKRTMSEESRCARCREVESEVVRVQQSEAKLITALDGIRCLHNARDNIELWYIADEALFPHDAPEPYAHLVKDDRAELVAENAKLREALKPFARAYDYGKLRSTRSPDQPFNDDHHIYGECADNTLTVGDLRAAKQAYEAARNEEDSCKTIHAPQVITIKGRLDELKTHSGYVSVLYHQVTGKPINCIFPSHQVEQAKSSVRKRVAVTGMAHFDRSGEPNSIQVRDFDSDVRELKSRDQLPQYSDLKGIDITGGLDSVDYVRMIRDGE